MRGAFFSGVLPVSIGPMRKLLASGLKWLIAAALLAGCIHLPPEVAAVVREADPPGQNHFRPGPPPPAVASREVSR